MSGVTTNQRNHRSMLAGIEVAVIEHRVAFNNTEYDHHHDERTNNNTTPSLIHADVRMDIG